MKEIILNNLNQPLIMADWFIVELVLLTILSLAIVGIRHVRNYIVDHREGVLEAVDEMKAETEKWRKDSEADRFKNRLLIEIISALTSIIRFVMNAVCIGEKVHCTTTYPDETEHEEDGIGTWWGPSAKDVMWFALLSAIGAAILSQYTESLSLEVAWALWIALAWIILWDFPNSGLNVFERSITYRIPRLFGQLAADIVSSVYHYTVWRVLLGLAVFLSFKYVLLPVYVPQDALLLENIIFFAIVAHFAWYFPYFGPSAIWHRLPTSPWHETEKVRGKDVPAQIQYNISNGKAVVSIKNSAVPIRGYGYVWVLRNGWMDYRFEFLTESGKDFHTKINIQPRYSSLDIIWCSKMMLHIQEPNEYQAAKEYLPEKRGVKQKIMEAIFELSEKTWNNLLGIKEINHD